MKRIALPSSFGWIGAVVLLVSAVAFAAGGPALPARAQEVDKSEPAPAGETTEKAEPAETSAEGEGEKEGKQVEVVDEGKVKEALDRGVEYLKQNQRASGEFVGLYHSSVESNLPGLHRGGYPLGETAIALLAMKYAGVPLEDPAFQKGLKFILERKTEKTYSNSLIAHVLATVAPEKETPELKQRMKDLAQFFAQGQLPNGAWTYFPVSARDMKTNHFLAGDNSNTQFAVLGLWQLALAGVEINPKVWKAAETYYLKNQGSSGGWTYWTPEAMAIGPNELRGATGATPTMTMTGLASLFIFLDQAHAVAQGRMRGTNLPPCGSSTDRLYDKRIDKAMERVEDDLAVWFSGKRIAHRAAMRRGQEDPQILNLVDLYYAYSVERVGEASGWKDLGQVSWYSEIGKLLLEEQNKDGSWGIKPRPGPSAGGLIPEAGKTESAALVAETSLAMLFLAKGRMPIFYNKLRYEGDWNNCRLDVANLTRYATSALEYRFNWQVVDIKSDPITWVDSPVLFFNGQQGPARLKPDEMKKLKTFVDNGGLVFAEACCGRTGFLTVVKRIAKNLWPDMEWQTLPEDHPIFTRKTQFDLEKKPAIEALVDKDGFAFFLLAPKDMSPAWHYYVLDDKDAFYFAVNVYRYATRGKPIRTRTTG